MFKYFVFCLLGSFGQFASAQLVTCFVEATQACSVYYNDVDKCEDTDCYLGEVSGLFRCPSNTQGCVVLPNSYSGYRAANPGETGFRSFDFQDGHACIKCGACNDCTTLGQKCKDDASNWSDGFTYYDLVGVDGCTG